MMILLLRKIKIYHELLCLLSPVISLMDETGMVEEEMTVHFSMWCKLLMIINIFYLDGRP